MEQHDEQFEPFDWSPLGEAWWRDKQKATGGDDRLLKFACARHRGCSQTQAARLAGYPDSEDGGIRQAGYRAARTRTVGTLLALAAAEAKGGYDGTVDAVEARRILSNLARGSDPSIKIRAVEAIAKMDAAELERQQAEREEHRYDPLRTLNQIAEISPLMALSLASHHGIPWQMPVKIRDALHEIEKLKRLVVDMATKQEEADVATVANVDPPEAEQQTAVSSTNGTAQRVA